MKRLRVRGPVTLALAVWGQVMACAGEPVELCPDVCVVGGGSSGIGAALAAARAGADVVLVEQQERLGGTSIQAYVCNWEPGPGCPFAREIYERLRQLPDAVAIVSDHNADRKKGPFGLWLPDPRDSYAQTLRRAGLPRRDWRAMVFEPDAFAGAVMGLLAETGRCRVLLRTRYTKPQAEGRRVRSILAESANGGRLRICAKAIIDCTGSAVLCRAVGCEVMLGPEPRSRFDEPSAPERPDKTLNAISLCYRIRPSEEPAKQEPPEPSVKGWQRVAHVSGLPNGDRLVNPLALIPGRMLIERGYEATMAEARRRALAHWHWLQGHAEFAGYELHSLAPMLGIRESYRAVGEYVLTQHDLAAGLSGQTHPDLIAVADHAMDVHGSGGRRVHGELKQPYGIPYRCLVPKGWRNLLVAGRCASFSHIAASSCRLSRTMLALGHAAGLAAAQAADRDIPATDVDVAAIQKELGLSRPASQAPR